MDIVAYTKNLIRNKKLDEESTAEHLYKNFVTSLNAEVREVLCNSAHKYNYIHANCFSLEIENFQPIMITQKSNGWQMEIARGPKWKSFNNFEDVLVDALKSNCFIR